MGAVGIRGESGDTGPKRHVSAPVELTIVRARQARARTPRRISDEVNEREARPAALVRVRTPEPSAQPPAGSGRLRHSRAFWLASVVLFALVSGATFAVLYLRQAAVERAGVAPEVIRASIPVSNLHMQVEAQGDRVLVSWNPRAAGIQSAEGGLLRIEDSSGRRDFPLDATQASNGSVLYHPASGDVTFRLQIHSREGKVFSDSLRVLDPAHAGPSAETSKPALNQPPERLQRVPSEAKPASTTPAPARVTAPPAPTQTAARNQPAREGAASPAGQPSNLLSSAAHTAPPLQLPNNVPATPTPEQTQPSATPQATDQSIEQPARSTASEPPPNPARQPAATLPSNTSAGAAISGVQARGMPSALSPNGDFTPPQPVKQVLPTLRSSLTATLQPDTRVDVRVLVDSRGRVKRAEAIGDLQNVDIGVQKAAVNAAKQWRFDPARLNGKRVASEHTIVFRFQPAGK